ncbi:hypothetical protein T484DRAFT_1792699, partial [Baffinella frigidus]
VKVILERLVRRISFEEVMEATPEEHKKFIVAIQKRLKRAKELRNRKKKGLAPEEEGEGEIGEDGKYRIKGGYEQALYGEEDEEEEGAEEDDEMEDFPAPAGRGAGKGGAPSGGRRGLEGTPAEKGAEGAGVSKGGLGQTKHGFPAGKGGLPVILGEEEEVILGEEEEVILGEEEEGRDSGRKRRRQEEDAEDVLAPIQEEEGRDSGRKRRRLEEDAGDVLAPIQAEKRARLSGKGGAATGGLAEKRERLALDAIRNDEGNAEVMALAAAADQASVARHARSWDQPESP